MVIVLITFIAAFSSFAIWVQFCAALIVIYIALEWKRIPATQRWAGLFLVGVGIIGAVYSGEWQSIVIEGLGKSRIFLVMYFAILWLQLPVSISPSLKATRELIVNQPPGRRFIFLSFGTHLIGSFLNLTGLSLLSPMAKDANSDVLKRRLTMAMLHGFSSQSCWSPFYLGMAVTLVSIPDLVWTEIAPFGVFLAFAMIVTCWGYDRIRFKKILKRPNIQITSTLSAREYLRVFFILVSLITSVIGISELLNTSIPISIGLVAPVFAVLWQVVIRYRETDVINQTANLIVHVFKLLPTIRNEALIFAAASVFGIGVAELIPTEALIGFINYSVPNLDMKLALMMAVFLVSGFIGLHPVIIVVTLSAVLPPESLGLPTWIVGLLYLASWGLSILLSPISGTTLFMSRSIGVSNRVLAWQWSPPSTILGAVVLLGLIVIIRHLFA